MDKHLIVPYEKIAQLLKLDEREIEMDTLLVESANEYIKLVTNRQIIARDIFNVVICSDGILSVTEWPIQKVCGFFDKAENQVDCIPTFEKSETSRAIHIDRKFDGTELGVVYRGGYEVDEVPSVIVEAVMKLFLHKKGKLNPSDTDTKMNGCDEVLDMLLPYMRRML